MPRAGPIARADHRGGRKGAAVPTRTSADPPAFRNRVLAALPREDRNRIASCLETVSLRDGTVLAEPHQALTHVYFPESGFASIVAIMGNGDTAEAGMVGREAAVGLSLFLGSPSLPARIVWQVPGRAERMAPEDFRREADVPGPFQDRLKLATQALMVQLTQSVGCNRLHPLEQRCARWLLGSRDRVDRDEFRLTQEFLALMLGVHRPSVTLVAGSLAEQGCITYRRGTISILDREGLEEVACECYRVVRDETRRLMGDFR